MIEGLIDKTVSQLRETYGLAGGILTAVKDGKAVLKKCFGMADAETKRPADTQTYFQIASCSKAFTTMLAAILCDEGKMTWDTPVKKLLPEFRMADSYAEEHVTPRDLACHRTGLSRHDAMRTYVREDRADLVRRTAFFPPAFSFRERYCYQNQMFVVLGYICERLTGKTWEQLVTERIAGPLGLDIVFRGYVNLSMINAAVPYDQEGGHIIRTPEVAGQASNPCGGIYINLDSLERWVRFLSEGGTLDGIRIVSKETFAELIRSNVVIPEKARHPQELHREYALGWMTSVYKGRRIVYHTGSTDGFNSMAGFFPGLSRGFALSVNTINTPAVSVLGCLLWDFLLEDTDDDYGWLAEFNKNDRRPVKTEKLPLSAAEARDFCGRFANPGYGELEFSYDNVGLRLRYGLTDMHFDRIAERQFAGTRHVDSLIYRAQFTEDGNLSMRFSTDAVCPIAFERIR